MKKTLFRPLTELEYEEAAQRYLQRLPPEHFMEALPQATQRKITLESLDLVHAFRPDVQTFSELLVQFPRGDEGEIGQVVPDNMVVVHHEPIKAVGSYNVSLQPVHPFWVLEYVSSNSKRKDYETNTSLYAKELKVQYLLLFHPEDQDFRLLRHDGIDQYQRVRANKAGRFAIPEIELEVALHEEWVRFWFRGELLALPGELLLELNETKRRLAQSQKDVAQAQKDVSSAGQPLADERAARMAAEQEIERLRAMLREKGEMPPG